MRLSRHDTALIGVLNKLVGLDAGLCGCGTFCLVLRVPERFDRLLNRMPDLVPATWTNGDCRAYQNGPGLMISDCAFMSPLGCIPSWRTLV